MKKEQGIQAKGKRKFVVTTDSRHNLPIAQNLLQRNFTANTPNQVWSGAITYIATDEGWLPGRGAGPVQSPCGGLEHAATHAKLIGDECVAHGLVPPCTRCRDHLPLRPWQPNTAVMNSSQPCMPIR